MDLSAADTPRAHAGAERYLILSAHHDYRTPRRASIHFIADALAQRGEVRFFSLRYSRLSVHKGDLRTIVDGRANRIEAHRGVECFLWKTALHPINMHSRLLRPLEDSLFWLYEHSPSKVLRVWLQEADVVVYESGITPIFFDLARRLNPRARHVYRANDDLATIRVADYVHRKFARVAAQMDALCLVSRAMAANIPSRRNVYLVPHGVDSGLAALGDPSPYGAGQHAVALGSMLFDPSFFAIAGRAFPEVSFHVIGSGQPRTPRYGANVRVYDDMAYAETIRYIKHADLGIAPYIAAAVPDYLADSSLKMLQYDYFALPTVCPHSVTGRYASRFGYAPGDASSIERAVRAALQAPHERSRQMLSWSEVADRLLDPARYDDTQV